MNQPGQEFDVKMGQFSSSSSSRDPRSRRRSHSERSSKASPSLLACVVCGRLPRFPASAVLGCQLGHVLCADCRAVGGALLSCPRCGSQEIDTKLKELDPVEEEREQDWLVFCPHKTAGCQTVCRASLLASHRAVCLHRPVTCPKAMFSLSCPYIGPFHTIQQHARDEHQLHLGVTELAPGLVSSKMFDKSMERSCCDDPTSAKFQPLELQHCGKLFYCYYERLADRRLWLFFIRMFHGREEAERYEARINVGHSSLAREQSERAGLQWRGAVAPYHMTRHQVREEGLVLGVPDEFMRNCKVGDILFRVWFHVQEKDHKKD